MNEQEVQNIRPDEVEALGDEVPFGTDTAVEERAADETVLFADWDKAGLPDEGKIGFTIAESEVSIIETEDDDYEKAALEIHITERPEGTVDETFYTNLSLDAQFVRQFKALVDGLGVRIEGAVTRQRLYELVGALKGLGGYGILVHKEGNDGVLRAQFGWKFGKSFKELEGKRKKKSKK